MSDFSKNNFFPKCQTSCFFCNTQQFIREIFFELSSFVEHNSNIFMRARSQRLMGPRLRGSCCPKPPKQTQKCPKMLIDKY